MSIITLILMLIVVAAVIYGVKLALAGNWKELIILAVVLVLVLWILGAMGLSLPSLPSAR
jgi:hypothetical protein